MLDGMNPSSVATSSGGTTLQVVARVSVLIFFLRRYSRATWALCGVENITPAVWSGVIFISLRLNG